MEKDKAHSTTNFSRKQRWIRSVLKIEYLVHDSIEYKNQNSERTGMKKDVGDRRLTREEKTHIFVQQNVDISRARNDKI